MRKIVISLLLVLGSICQASNVYVNHTGCNIPPYDTEAKACTNIRTALDFADSGDIVWIKADQDYIMNGTDQQNSQFVIGNNDNVTIKGYYNTIGDQDYGGTYYKDPDHGWVVIDASNGVFNVFYQKAANICYHNIKTVNVNLFFHSFYLQTNSHAGGMIENCWTTGGYRAVITVNAGPVIVRDCVFTGDYASPVSILRFTSGVNGGVNSAVVEDCYFEFGNTGEGIVASYNSSCGMIDIRNNIFKVTQRLVSDNLISITFTNGGTIANNTIYSTSPINVGNAILIASTARNVQIYNNIITGCWCDINDLSTGGVAFGGWNCLYNNLYQIWTLRTGDITSNPQFMDAAHGDFRLKPTSPCLNTGKPTMGGGYTSMGAWQPSLFWPPEIFVPVGDLNNDFRVDFYDFAKMASNWLIDCTTDPNNPSCVPK